MLLMNRYDEFQIPHSSTCIIQNKGILKDGDVVTITSPIFSSTNFTSGPMTTSDTFNVPLHLMNKDEHIESNGNMKATLICDDCDPFAMYVRQLT